MLFCDTVNISENCIFIFFLEKNFKRSNAFKRRIPIYISIKYLIFYTYIYVMLRLANIGACYFVIQSILAKIAFSFFFGL